MIIHLRSYMYSVCTVCSYRISFKNSADNKIPMLSLNLCGLIRGKIAKLMP